LYVGVYVGQLYVNENILKDILQTFLKIFSCAYIGDYDFPARYLDEIL